MSQGKHRLDGARQGKFKKRKVKTVAEGSAEDVLLLDIKALRLNHSSNEETQGTSADISRESSPSFSRFDEVEVDIVELGSSGDGLGFTADGRNDVVLVPFTVPGDKVLARVHAILSTHSLADLVKVINPSSNRDDSLVGCKYFGKCSGCQLQMMRYKDQLEFKRSTIVKAFRRYFTADDLSIPEISETHPSPLQYGYRTKITPHFDMPRSRSRDSGPQSPKEIGFVEKGRRRILDIEECPIATAPLNAGLTEQRAIARQKTYKRGATILLREALDSQDDNLPPEDLPKKCVTDANEIISEKVNKFLFQFPAGSFFQNNNAILSDFTGYAYSQIVSTFGELGFTNEPRYLVDAYCGSGLFSITCSKGFESVVGVEISADSVKYAKLNAEANKIQNTTFLTGSAEKIFDLVKTPPDQTAMIIDPPRKGCDEVFLDQLLKFNPRVVIYVSCGVHTQARDIDYLSRKEEGRYKVTAIKGFDLFPQTHHVESIATLVRYQGIS